MPIFSCLVQKCQLGNTLVDGHDVSRRQLNRRVSSSARRRSECVLRTQQSNCGGDGAGWYYVHPRAHGNTLLLQGRRGRVWECIRRGIPQLLGAGNSACGAFGDSAIVVGRPDSVPLDCYQARLVFETGRYATTATRTGYACVGFRVLSRTLSADGVGQLRVGEG